MDKIYFKAFIRVVKKFDVESNSNYYDDKIEHTNIVREPLIIAKDKKEVKEYLLKKYPQFFQNNKVYEKTTKDNFQFFYVVIFKLYDFEIDLINRGSWKCAYCNTEHVNRYEVRPLKHVRLFGDDVEFCGFDCLDNYRKTHINNNNIFKEEEYYITVESLNYIYKITEKTTGKSYIGKTKNMPFFRWYNHLKHNTSPFGLYFRQSQLNNWTFEILEILPSDTPDSEIFRVESGYIMKYDSIKNGFNTLISYKDDKIK